jgi:hypothetical protein
LTRHKNEFEVVDNRRFDRGCISHYFITSAEKMQVEAEKMRGDIDDPLHDRAVAPGRPPRISRQFGQARTRSLRPDLEIGVTTHSFAIFNFPPNFAVEFYKAGRITIARQSTRDCAASRFVYRDQEPQAGLSGFDCEGTHESDRDRGDRTD